MKNNSKGTTMIEVIVSFTILILTMAVFSRAIVITGRSATASGQKLAASRELTGDYYRGNLPVSTTTKTLHFKASSGTESFSLPAEVRIFEGSSGNLCDIRLAPQTIGEED